MSGHPKKQRLSDSIYKRTTRIVEAHTYAWENAGTIYQLPEPLSLLICDSKGRLRSVSAEPILKRASADITALVDQITSRLILLVETLVSEEYVSAVMAREEWAVSALHNWPVLAWQKGDFAEDGQGGALSFGGWPAQARPADVIEWLEQRKHWEPAPHLQTILASGKLSYPWLIDGELYSVPLVACLYLAEQEIEAGRRKPAIAVDAGKPHHRLIASWAKHPDDRPAPKTEESLTGYTYKLLVAGDEYQLSLPNIPSDAPNEALTRQLRALLGPKGMRHWTAFLSLLSREGNRQGWVRWSVKEHQKALGHRDSYAQKDRVRTETSGLIKKFTELEFAVVDKDGSTRERRPLVLVSSRLEKKNDDDEWELDGAILKINPLLYGGVRKDSGKLGTNFWPQSSQLPTINHQQYPYAHALGLILAQRWRFALNSGLDHIEYTGANLLKAAGIKQNQQRPERAWTRLENTIDVLQKHDALGRVNIDKRATNANSVWRLYPPDWQADRAYRKLPPVEEWYEALPLTGAELKAWRSKMGITQAELAAQIGMSRAAIGNAERKPDNRLGKRLSKALSNLQMTQNQTTPGAK